MPIRHLTLILIASSLCSTLCFGAISIIADPNLPAPARHGVDAIVAALKAKDQDAAFADSIDRAGNDVIIAGLSTGSGAKFIDAKDLPKTPESLVVRRTTSGDKRVLAIVGSDPRGLMYACLDVADRIGWSDSKGDPFKEVRDISESPDCPERAISVYTMQRAYFEQRLYDAHYWDKYFDLLAKDRFNSFVLIFGYENGGFLAPPYPYFFNVDGFPDVRMVGITPEQQQKNLAALNRLIQQAHDRGIDVTIGIWDHIYRGGVQANGVPGTEDALKKPTPGLVWGVTTDNLIPYTKAALTKFLREVHGIDAIQFRMHDESGLKNSEQGPFWHDIARLMQKEAPNIRFDARAKGLPDSVIDDIVSTGIPFRVDTKYWMEQMGMPWHPTHINEQDQQNRRHSYADLLHYPQTYKIHWRMFNGGTTRILLWGDPDYVRRFVETTHLYDGDGFEINEPLCTKMQGQAQDVKPFDLLKPEYRYTEYEFERYWYQLMLFGRLGYDPKTPSEVWNREFERRFGKDAGPHIEKALNRASWILPRIVAAVYPYSAFPMTRGWAEKQPLGDLPHYAMNQGSDVAQFASFDEFVQCVADKTGTAKITPAETGRWFADAADEINREIGRANVARLPQGDSDEGKEFVVTRADLETLANLALFHSSRCDAAVAYDVYLRTKQPDAFDVAVRQERHAIDHWQGIVDSAAGIYADDLMFGNRKAGLCGHWKDELPALESGLAKLKVQRANLDNNHSPPTTAPVDLDASVPENNVLNVQHEPVRQARAGEPLKIVAHAYSASGIKWVRLRCRSVNQRLDYDTIPMTPTGNPDEYQAIVPAEEISPRFDFMYYVEAMDKDGVGCIWPDFEKQTPYVVVKLQR